VDGPCRIVLEGLPQVEHEGVDRPRCRRPVHAPDFREQLLAGHHLALVLHEVFQQFHLQAREFDRHVSNRSFPGLEVDLRGAKSHGCRRGGVDRLGGPLVAASPGEQAADDRQEFLEVEGLLQVDVGAGVEAADSVLDERPRGEHHDRDVVSLGPDLFADGVAAHAGKHQVEHHQFDRWRRRGEKVEGGGAVAGGGHRVALSLEVELDSKGEMLLVLDDEDVRHGGAFRMAVRLMEET